MTNILPNWRYSSWLFAGVLLVCFSISVMVRFQQFKTWEKSPAVFFVGDRPMMSTLDAPNWLRWAREYNEGTFSFEDSFNLETILTWRRIWRQF